MTNRHGDLPSYRSGDYNSYRNGDLPSNRYGDYTPKYGDYSQRYGDQSPRYGDYTQRSGNLPSYRSGDQTQRSGVLPLTSRYGSQYDASYKDKSNVTPYSPRNDSLNKTKTKLLPPVVVAAKLRKQKQEENHLMSYLNQQNMMLELLSSRIGQQQRDYMDKQRRDLNERLRMLEMENALKLQEYELLEMEAQEMHRRPKDSEKTKKKKKKANQFSGLLEKLMFKKNFKDIPKDIFDKLNAPEKPPEDPYNQMGPRGYPGYPGEMYQGPDGMYDPYYGQGGYDTRTGYYPGGPNAGGQGENRDSRSAYGMEEGPKKRNTKRSKSKKGKGKNKKNLDQDEEEEDVEEIEVLEEEEEKPKNTRHTRK